MKPGVITPILFVVLLLTFGEIVYASDKVNLRLTAEPCLSAKRNPKSALLSTDFENTLRNQIINDPVKIQALVGALSRACRGEAIDLTPTNKYKRLKDLLRIAREDYEANGSISRETLRTLEHEVDVRKEDVINSQGKIVGWQLVIGQKSKAEMHIKTAASLASHGDLFVEAFHQLSALQNVRAEEKILLNAIEKSARAILDNPDENEDGRLGWGRVWFKGKDGLLLHTTVPRHNMYFGGYTYFPRLNCEMSLPLKEETFDHAHNTIFLIEAFLVTRDRALAKRIIATVGKSFDDTFDEGGEGKQPESHGWYYWKQLGKGRDIGREKCEVGREIKNTNLRMGVALLAFSEILRRNQDELGVEPGFRFNWQKYVNRATRIIRTNNYEIFENNNFGYQGTNSRSVELLQDQDVKPLLYDRTQVTAGLNYDEIGDLKEVITGGNKLVGKEPPASVTICGGSVSGPTRDRGVAGACWNHLAFEAEDYFRVARFTNAWDDQDRANLRGYLDAMTRNLAAAKIVHDGRAFRYLHYFPRTQEKVVSNEVINAAFYGLFCMAKNLNKKSSVGKLPVPHQRVLRSFLEMCERMPTETEETGVTWRKGYRFYELYLAADRFRIPHNDWLLMNKN